MYLSVYFILAVAAMAGAILACWYVKIMLSLFITVQIADLLVSRTLLVNMVTKSALVLHDVTLRAVMR